MLTLRVASGRMALGLALLAAVPMAAPCAQELGRLFTTTAERRTLDRLRLEAQIARPLPAPEPPTDRTVTVTQPSGPSVSRLEVNGIVRRSRGPATVWVNGAQVERGLVSREGLTVQASPRSGGGVQVSLPSGLSTVRLKPGQAVDVNTGTLVDAFERRPDPAAQSGIQTPPELSGAAAASGADAPPASSGPASGDASSPSPTAPIPTASKSPPQRLSHRQLRELSALPPVQRADAIRALGATAGPTGPAKQ